MPGRVSTKRVACQQCHNTLRFVYSRAEMTTSDPERPPYRADHVGSLLRPSELLAARQRLREGVIDEAELRAVEDDAVRAVIQMQQDVGLRAVTDGEFRRSSWHMDFIYELGG